MSSHNTFPLRLRLREDSSEKQVPKIWAHLRFDRLSVLQAQHPSTPLAMILDDHVTMINSLARDQGIVCGDHASTVHNGVMMFDEDELLLSSRRHMMQIFYFLQRFRGVTVQLTGLHEMTIDITQWVVKATDRIAAGALAIDDNMDSLALWSASASRCPGKVFSSPRFAEQQPFKMIAFGLAADFVTHLCNRVQTQCNGQKIHAGVATLPIVARLLSNLATHGEVATLASTDQNYLMETVYERFETMLHQESILSRSDIQTLVPLEPEVSMTIATLRSVWNDCQTGMSIHERGAKIHDWLQGIFIPQGDLITGGGGMAMQSCMTWVRFFSEGLKGDQNILAALKELAKTLLRFVRNHMFNAGPLHEPDEPWAYHSNTLYMFLGNTSSTEASYHIEHGSKVGRWMCIPQLFDLDMPFKDSVDPVVNMLQILVQGFGVPVEHLNVSRLTLTLQRIEKKIHSPLYPDVEVVDDGIDFSALWRNTHCHNSWPVRPDIKCDFCDEYMQKHLMLSHKQCYHPLCIGREGWSRPTRSRSEGYPSRSQPAQPRIEGLPWFGSKEPDAKLNHDSDTGSEDNMGEEFSEDLWAYGDPTPLGEDEDATGQEEDAAEQEKDSSEKSGDKTEEEDVWRQGEHETTW